MGNQTETILQNLLSCPHPLIDSPASKWTATRHRDSLATLTARMLLVTGGNRLGNLERQTSFRDLFLPHVNTIMHAIAGFLGQ